MSWLVLGLARSGQAAALALRRRGEEVIGIDASPSLDVGRLAEAGVEVHLGTEEERLLDGVETLVKSPGVPGEAPLVQAARTRGIPVWSEVELGSRLLATTIVARDRDEREDDDERAARRDAAGSRRRERRAGADRAGRQRPTGRGRRLRGLELPAGGHPRVQAARRRAAEPRAGPPRPPRQLRGLCRREAADLREPGRGRRRGRPAPLRADPGSTRSGSSSHRPTSFQPSR